MNLKIKIVITTICTLSFLNAEYLFQVKNKGEYFGEVSCISLENATEGNNSNLCEAKGTSFEGKELYVLNGKAFELIEATPNQAFSCNGNGAFTINSYATDQEAKSIAAAKNINVYTPLNSHVSYYHNVSNYARGRAYTVNAEGVYNVNYMYNIEQRTNSLCSPVRVNLGNSSVLLQAENGSSCASPWYARTTIYDANNLNIKACIVPF